MVLFGDVVVSMFDVVTTHPVIPTGSENVTHTIASIIVLIMKIFGVFLVVAQTSVEPARYVHL
jgi:hypothetical protein